MIECPMCIGEGKDWPSNNTCELCDGIGEIVQPSNALDYVELFTSCLNTDGGNTVHDTLQSVARIIREAKKLYEDDS